MWLGCGYDACSFAAGRSGGGWAEQQRLTAAFTAALGVPPRHTHLLSFLGEFTRTAV